MDYLKFVEHHRATNADITIGCLPVDYERASDFGLMKVNDEGEIVVRFTIRRVGLTCSGNSAPGMVANNPYACQLIEGLHRWIAVPAMPPLFECTMVIA